MKPKKETIHLARDAEGNLVDKYGRIMQYVDGELQPTGRCSWYSSYQIEAMRKPTAIKQKKR